MDFARQLKKFRSPSYPINTTLPILDQPAVACRVDCQPIDLCRHLRAVGMAVWVLLGMLGMLVLSGLPQAQGAGPVAALTRLHSFGDPLADAIYPEARVIEGSKEVLYGTTPQGGSGYGTVFRVNKDGTGLSLNLSVSRLMVAAAEAAELRHEEPAGATAALSQSISPGMSHSAFAPENLKELQNHSKRTV